MSFFNKVKGLLVEETSDSGAVVDDLDAQISSIGKITTSPNNAITVEEMVRRAPGPNLEDIQATAPTPSPAGVARESASAALPERLINGKVDCSKIYAQAGVPAMSFGADEALDLISSLPAELPMENKRAMLIPMLSAMSKSTGVTPALVLGDAALKLKALETLQTSFDAQVAEFTSGTEKQIRSYEEKIEAAKKSLIAIKEQQLSIHQMLAEEEDRLDDLAEYLTLDVAPSKFAPQIKL